MDTSWHKRERIGVDPTIARILFALSALWDSGAVYSTITLVELLARAGKNASLFVLRGLCGGQTTPRLPIPVVYGLECASRTSWIVKIPKIRGLFRLAGNGWDRLRLVIRTAQTARRQDIAVIAWESGDALWIPAFVALILSKSTILILRSPISHSLRDYPDLPGRPGLALAARRAKRVVCASGDLVAITCRELGVARGSVESIADGIDIDSVTSRSQQPAADKDIVNGPPYVLGLGRLAPEMGFDLLIRAHDVVRRSGHHHRLVIAGPRDRTALECLIDDLGVSDTVQLLGHRVNPYPLLKNASIFCLSSRYEGASLALMEAAALGTPMVATDCGGGVRRTLRDGDYGRLVPVGSVGALADAIREHFDSPQLLQRKAAASFADRDRLSVDHTAASYSALIDRVLAESGSN